MRLVWIRLLGFLLLILIAIGGYLYLQDQTPVVPNIVQTKQETKTNDLDLAREQLLAQLNKKPRNRRKTIRLPRKKKLTPPKPKTKRAAGRQKRRHLPLGVVLLDQVKVYSSADSWRKTVYTMTTGDFVRVFDKPEEKGRRLIQPGVDIYLAQTSKEFAAAGNRFPDRAGWVNSNQIHIFEPKQAIEFTQDVEPMTLGRDPDFSTLSFYERAMKNPDPVVHRVIGPRLISFLGIHEDYSPAWGALYRDYDSKIRSVSLSELKKRGVKNNREIIEDLIKRLAELTRTKATGEQEIEVTTILAILSDTGNPRVPVALETFIEGWKKNQGKSVLNAANETLRKFRN